MLSINRKAVLTGYWQSSKNWESFKKHFFRYLCIRESVRNDVYKDHKGFLTVGVGHLVQPKDFLVFGQVISNDRILDFFNIDYSRLKIDSIVNSASWWSVPQKVAVGSFVWVHGYGQFLNGQTHKILMDSKSTYDQIQAWVKKNWDLTSPGNQSRNIADFQLFKTVKEGGSGLYAASFAPSGDFYYSFAAGDSYFEKVFGASLPGSVTPAGRNLGSGNISLFSLVAVVGVIAWFVARK